MNILWIDQSRWNVDLSVYGNILVSFKGAIVWNKRLHVDTNYICLGDKPYLIRNSWKTSKLSVLRYYAGMLIKIESAKR